MPNISKFEILLVRTLFSVFLIIEFEFFRYFCFRFLIKFQDFTIFQNFRDFSKKLEGASRPSLRHAEGATSLKIRHFRHVLVDCSGSWQSFAISVRQFLLWYVLMLRFGPRVTGKFVWYRILEIQGRWWTPVFAKYRFLLIFCWFLVMIGVVSLVFNCLVDRIEFASAFRFRLVCSHLSLLCTVGLWHRIFEIVVGCGAKHSVLSGNLHARRSLDSGGSAANMWNKAPFLKIRQANVKIEPWDKKCPYDMHRASVSWPQTWNRLNFLRGSAAHFSHFMTGHSRNFEKNRNLLFSIRQPFYGIFACRTSNSPSKITPLDCFILWFASLNKKCFFNA